MKRICSWAGMFVVSAFVGALAASADDYTGDPAADGWLLHGNSLANGIYIRGVAGLSFDVYSDTFTITTNSPLWDGTLADPNSGFWHPGDLVLGLGGVNESGYIYEPRMVAKFGAAGATFSPSTLPSPAGNGNGSFSGGNAGNGGVQADYEYQFTLGETNLNPADQNGGIELPDNVLYYSGGSSNIDPVYGAILARFQQDGQGRDVLQSWEVAVDLTALSDPDRANFGSEVPIIDGRSDMALQENLGDYTDAFVVPEPSTYSLVIISLAAFGWTFKRRCDAKT